MLVTELETPALLLDVARLERNVERMRRALARHGVPLRPHAKTAKCAEIVRLALAGQPGGIAVSTLREAECFLERDIRDILYAVGIAPGKLAHVAQLIRRGADITVVLDGFEAAAALRESAAGHGVRFPVLIELDVDGHRAGVSPGSEKLLELGGVLAASPGTELRGVMTHAGASYECRGVAAIEAMAERERDGAVRAAGRLRAAGFPAPVVSVGSTPTATFARSLDGVSEVRAGVYMFQDLVMAGLGVCAPDDIAVSVLVSVIGHQPQRGWVITDGGWMALSRDRGTASQALDQGYGVACDVAGRPLPEDVIVASANQEHGILARRDGGPLDPARYPVGTLLRVLPNHACATAAQHGSYRVVAGEPPAVTATWRRFGGW